MDFWSLTPEIILSVAAAALMMGEAFWPGRRLAWIWFSTASLAAAAQSLLFPVPQAEGAASLSFNMLASDPMGQYFKIILIAGMILVLWISAGSNDLGKIKSWGSYCALLLLSLVGMMFLVAAVDFLMVIIGIELLGVTSFVLAGFLKKDRRSSEGAMKFFLIGAFSSGLMFYGISILYGYLGSTGFDALLKAPHAENAAMLPLAGGVLFILAGLGFKVAMAPFHMWVPDVYEGSPLPVTAFLSVAPKAAALGVLSRVLANHSDLGLSWVLAVLAAATMTIGNLSALSQHNVKRLMGYSSVAQMGYALVAFVAAGPLGLRAVSIYALAYLFMNLGAFACIALAVNDSSTEDLEGFSGLSQRSLPLAMLTAVFLFSLTGLPPLVGFIGKFSVFTAAVSSGWVWLAVVGVINSTISFYYYFGIVRRMFFSAPLPGRDGRRVAFSIPLTGCAAAALAITLAAGIFPHEVLAWVQRIFP